MTVKLFLGLLFFLLIEIDSIAQASKEIRLNILNPGIAFEHPIGKKTTVEYNFGVGYNYSYPWINTEYGENGFQGQLAPFFDIQARNYFNLQKLEQGKRKSAKFVALRYLFNGPRIAGNVRTNENYSMAVGPTWGFKRSYEKWTLLGSVGPIYYFDLTGSDGIFPFNFEINLGYRLKK